MPLMLLYRPTPIVQLRLPSLRQMDVSLFVKREDQNHPTVSGNKWWKLKHNLEAATRQQAGTILSFGGAYSNHIYALAAATAELGLKSIGIIRGEQPAQLSPTLQFAEAQGMRLHFLSREAYRQKSSEELINTMRQEWGAFFYVPEGGSNLLGVRGAADWAMQLQKEVDFDFVCLPVGSGGTLAGISQQLSTTRQAVGYAVLKNAGFLFREVQQLGGAMDRLRLSTDFHGGGYARASESLLHFIEKMEKDYQLPLDPVYTAKALYGVLEEVKQGLFPRGSTILFLHTGGLQGRLGFGLPA
jgi:1-aminocyclopropane-1-carboxylate deaminase